MKLLILLSVFLLLASLFIYNAVIGEHFAGNTTVYMDPLTPPIIDNTEYVCQSGGQIGANMCNYA